MNYETIIQAAIQFATEAHKGQFRKDGKRYITHPLAVASLAHKNMKAEDVNLYNIVSVDSIMDVVEKHYVIVQILALFHDIPEDVDSYKNQECLLVNAFNASVNYYLSGHMMDELVIGLKVLNKNNHKNYREYILALKNNVYARTVKLSDLQHNMSDLAEGSLKDKYRLAEYILIH